MKKPAYADLGDLKEDRRIDLIGYAVMVQKKTVTFIGNYEPGNCRWATQMEQAQNKRSNLLINFDGQSLCLKEVARRSGIKYDTLRARIFRRGWTVEMALNSPVKG